MKKIFSLFLCLTMAFSICSCVKSEEKNCLDILCELLVLAKGQITDEESLYSSDAGEGEAGYFSDDLRVALYGEKRAEECSSMIEECALFISAREVEELAVFKCYSRSDTDSIASMCLERADALRVALRSLSDEDTSQKTHVEIHGRYVLFSFMGRSEAIAEHFYKLT